MLSNQSQFTSDARKIDKIILARETINVFLWPRNLYGKRIQLFVWSVVQIELIIWVRTLFKSNRH